MFKVLSLYQSFKGQWTLQRNISEQGKMHGIASFDVSDIHDNILFYNEQGVFINVQNVQFNTHRDYIYRYQDEKIMVFFPENKGIESLFYVLKFEFNQHRIIKGNGFYTCKQDSYKIIYNFLNKNNFEILYLVEGPTKNYSSNTLFSRI